MSEPAYALGRADYSDGKSLSDNRFKVASPLYREWERGWTDALRGDPLLDAAEKAARLGED
jgi:hypothetical protein